MAPVQRDPLSVAYDTYAHRMLMRARRKHQSGSPGWTYVWIASPGHEVRNLDAGGLTRHERAFRRALYYPIIQLPRQQARRTGSTPLYVWSLRTEMVNGFERRGSRYGRWCRLRLYRYGARTYTAAEKRRGPGYTSDPALRSYIGEGGVRVIPRASRVA